MNQPADSTRAFWITQGVGRTLGIRFGEAIQDGRFSTTRYARMVDRCARCDQHDRCLAWLGAPGPSHHSAPDFCPNAAELDHLAARRNTPLRADKPV
jgi:hypothetical protein